MNFSVVSLFSIATFCNTALYIETRFTFHYVAIPWRHLVGDGMGGSGSGGAGVNQAERPSLAL